jgi:hypothetical protein
MDERFVLNPFGIGKLTGQIHAGDLFNVYTAELCDQEVAIKVPSPNGKEYYGADYSGIQTSVWRGSVEKGNYERVGWTGAGLSSMELGIRMLMIEGQLINWTNGAWNHNVIGMGTWDGLSGINKMSIYKHVPEPDRFVPVMVMPLYKAQAFSAFSNKEKREMFPGILPALWDALCAMDHGDLAESNILLDDDLTRFHLVDPGVLLASLALTPAREEQRTEEYWYASEFCFFTTNAANYPLIPPYADLDSHNWGNCEGWFSMILDSPHYWPGESLFSPLSRVPTVTGGKIEKRIKPSAQDLLALGIMYFRILSGRELFLGRPVMGDRPAWECDFGELYGSDNRLTPLFEVCKALDEGYILKELESIEIAKKEFVLAHALLNLRINTKEDLMALLD